MIDLKALVSAIQECMHTAADALTKKNLEIFDQFFEDADNIEDIKEKVQGAVETVSGIPDSDLDSAKEAIRQAAEAINAAADAMKGGVSDKSSGKYKNLRPKTVVIQYPNVTGKGVVVHNVHVPLITLVPLSMAQVSELRFKTKLEICHEEDKLSVAFPPKKKEDANGSSTNAPDDEPHRANATLEIVLNPTSASQGLLKLVEGYEKALRAQIPG